MSTPRNAAVPLHREVEEVWDRLRAEFALHDGFWLAFLFGSEPAVVAELLNRSRDLARSSVRRIEHIELADASDTWPALHNLLAPAPQDLAATWVIDSRAAAFDRSERWARPLRRLNERRDALRAARPSALLFACPQGSLPMVRDAAPDLWSFRSLTATLAPDAPASPPASPSVPAIVGRTQSWLSPVAGDPVVVSPPVADALRRAASALRTGRLDLALSAVETAATAAEGAEDTALVHAWLAQVRDRQGEPTEAVRHAAVALSAQVPFEQATTEAVLGILVESAQPAVAEQAGEALVEMHRAVAERQPDTPESLRDLSISLDNVARIQHTRGQLDDALNAAVQARDVYRVFAGHHPPPLSDPDELAALEDSIAELTESLSAP